MAWIVSTSCCSLPHVTKRERPTQWRRWARQPQTVRLRRTIFQIHLWSGITLGLYIFFISVTGSVLVYRNELYVAATPEPLISTDPGPLLSDDELREAATRTYPGYRVTRFVRARNPDEAVVIWLERDAETSVANAPMPLTLRPDGPPSRSACRSISVVTSQIPISAELPTSAPLRGSKRLFVIALSRSSQITTASSGLRARTNRVMR